MGKKLKIPNVHYIFGQNYSEAAFLLSGMHQNQVQVSFLAKKKKKIIFT
jgi:hypothetical protein